MIQAGLIGTPLGHSWSADYFAQRHPDCRYRAYELNALDNLRQLVAQERLDGFNVTIPYKQAILPYLDELEGDAAEIGAVNCVCVRHVGGELHLTGYNTDSPAFAETLQPLLQPWHRHALVLGTGGAAQAVAYALRQRSVAVTLVSRTPHNHPGSIGYDQLASCLTNLQPPIQQSQLSTLNSQFSILINATPVGMWPHTGQTPMSDLSGIGTRHLCFDLVYNPPQSRWLQECARCGATVCNGLSMLHRQAERSYALWRK